MKKVGINLLSVVSDYFAIVAWIEQNVDDFQFTMNGWCPDYFDPIDMLEPLHSTNGSNNLSRLKNDTIDANIDALNYLSPGSIERQNVIDTIVTQVIVKQAAAMYTVASADLIAWNVNPKNGIMGGEEVLLNVRRDKYFYPIDFAPTSLDDAITIPGYSLLMSFLFLSVCIVILSSLVKNQEISV